MPRTENEVDYLVLAPTGSTSRWNLERWDVQTTTGERTLIWGAIEGLRPGELLDRIRELVTASNTEGYPIKVVVVEKDHIRNYLARMPGFWEFAQDVRFLHAESLDRSDEQILRAILAEAYRDGGKHLPAEGPKYLETKRRQLDEGRGVDHLLADFLAESNLPLVIHAAGLPTRRQIEAERDLPEDQPMRRHRVQGAVIRRGRMFPDLGRFEKPREEPIPIPHDHPARRSESWVGVIMPPKGGRR